MYWPSRVQRLMRSVCGTRKVSWLSITPDQVATETREDGEAPGARSRPGQQGVAEEGPAVRAARWPLRTRGEAPQVGKCGLEHGVRRFPGPSAACARLTSPGAGSLGLFRKVRAVNRLRSTATGRDSIPFWDECPAVCEARRFLGRI